MFEARLKFETRLKIFKFGSGKFFVTVVLGHCHLCWRVTGNKAYSPFNNGKQSIRMCSQ